MTCAICGAALNPGAMFCGECGSKVTPGSVIPPVQPVAAPAAPIVPLVVAPTVAPVVTPVQPVVTPAPPVFEPLNDDFDETVISPRAPILTITGPDGIPHVIRTATVIGRAPQRPADRPEVDVLALADVSKSLSKSHAIVLPHGDELVIEDVGSTNGVIIKHPDGRETVLPAHRPFPLAVGTVLELGDYVLTIGQR